MARNRELVELEKDLHQDLGNQDPAIRQRLRQRVREFLLEDIRKLPGCQGVKERKDIMDTIRTQAEADLLRRLIERPKDFTTKEMKELWRGSTIPDTALAPEAKKDPIAFLDELQVPDAVKGQIMAAMVETIRGELTSGK